MKKKVAVIHTSQVLCAPIAALFEELIPDVEMKNFIDEKLLSDVMANDGLSNRLRQRILYLCLAAQASGADMILNACSSVGESMDYVGDLVDIPCLKVDLPMAEAAVSAGSDIGVIGTVGTTLAPSGRLISTVAAGKGRSAKVTTYLVEGAFHALSVEKNPDKHNDLVIKTVEEAAAKHDVVVLAQGSMGVLMPRLTHLKTPVFTSLRMGVERTRDMLAKM